MGDQQKINEALYRAVEHRDFDGIREALAQGADVNYIHKDKTHEFSALHSAAYNGDRAAMALLIDAGGSLRAGDRYGRLPLDVAIQFGKEEFAIWLAELPQCETVKSKRAIGIAASRAFVALIDILVKQGCGTTLRTEIQDPPLLGAVRSGSVVAVEKILSLGVDVNETFKNKYTALHHASEKGLVDIAQRLVAAGADVNARQAAGFTPLHSATSSNNPGMVKFLVSAGTDGLAVGNDGWTAFQYAINFGKTHAMTALEELGFGEPMGVDILNGKLVDAAKRKYADLVGKLVELGADPYHKAGGRTLLQIAQSDEVKQAILAARTVAAIERTSDVAIAQGPVRSSSMSPI